MTQDTTHNLRAIGAFLISAFNGEELTELFYYAESPALREVRHQFLPGESLPAWVQKAVSYCERRYLIDDLLAEIERARPGQFEDRPAVGTTPPPPPDPDTLPDPGELPPGSRIPFSRNALFTGRVQPLLDLARALFHDGASATVVTQVVQGMGGIGKTQLAVEFAYRYGRFFRGVHWIPAAQPDLIGAEIAECGRRMSLSHWPQEQPEQIERALLAWREAGPRLVILDNLEDVEAARQWLARLQGKGIRIMLTARLSNWPADLGLAPLPLDLFTPAESLAFLREYLDGDRATDAELAALAERLGYLPLALELVARYLVELRRLTVSSYLTKLDDVFADPAFAAWRADLGNPTDHDLDLATTFHLSWEEVEDEDARRLFLAAGHCAPNQPIPCELLEKAAELDELSCDEALPTLTGLGLLELQDPPAGPAIHPLLAEYARTLPGASDALSDLTDALASFSIRANKSLLPTPFFPLRAHVETAAPAAEAAYLDGAGTVWNELGLHLKMVSDYAGARAACERALAIDESVHGLDHPNVARDVNNLGSVLHDLGDLAGARAAFERALAIDEAVYGPDHSEVATDVNNLGSVLQDLGDLAGARAAYERALIIFEKQLGPEHPNVATMFSNLGLVLKALGDLAGARAAYERALAIDEAVYGFDHPEVAIRVNNLGGMLKALGDLAGAQAAFERALAIFERQLGCCHPNVATLVNNLGMVLQDLGDLAGARAAFERALAIDEAVHGADHPEVAIRVNNLGSVLQDLGDLAGAQAAYERALAIDEAVYGLNHPSVARDVNNLGLVLQDLGDLAGARAAYEWALAIDEAIYGPDHPEVATDVNNLGLVLQDLGDLAGARAAYERALAIDEAVCGPDHPSVATSVNTLGSVLQDLGDLAGARAAYERALAIFEAVYGPDHPSTRIVQDNLATLDD